MSDQDIQRHDARPRGFALPALAGSAFPDRAKAAIGAFFGIGLTGLVCGILLGTGFGHPLLVAPMGASAVLLFAVPASPLAQPWSVVGGNVLSALVGVAMAKMVPDTTLAAALAVGCAIGAMALCRCLHPPGGAMALSAVLGSATGASHYMFALIPVAANSVLMVIVAMLFHRVAGNVYPHVVPKPQSVHGTRDDPPSLRTPSQTDVDAAINAYGEALDVGAADLRKLVHDAEMLAAERTHGHVTCGEIMSRDVIAVEESGPIAGLSELLAERRLLSVPVLDKGGRVTGMVGPLDLAPPGARVGDIASLPYIVHQDTPIAALLRPLTSGERREAVVVEDEQMLCGLITQTDLLAAVALRRP